MGRWWLRRLSASALLVLGVCLIVFFLLHMIPGDPAELILGEGSQAADRLRLHKALGLDESLGMQFLLFVKSLAHGWGTSFALQRSVLDLILERFPHTLLLALFGLAGASMLSLPAGAWAARRGGKTDALVIALSALSLSLPIFVVAPVAVLIFSIRLRWLPVAGSGGLQHLILPASCLALALSGSLTPLVRKIFQEILHQDFVRTARAKGLSERVVLFKHALRNACVPLLTVLGQMLGSLLGGAIVTEILFDWPGLGKLFYTAFQSRDYPLIQGVVLWVALGYIAINLFVDLLYAISDPRIRLDV